MSEVKRWTMKFNGGQSGMFVAEDGPWVAYEDHDTLRAEVERLRRIEDLANAMLDASPEKMAIAERCLAEACGRKG